MIVELHLTCVPVASIAYSVQWGGYCCCHVRTRTVCFQGQDVTWKISKVNLMGIAKLVNNESNELLTLDKWIMSRSLTFTTSRMIGQTAVLGTFKVERRFVAKLQSTKVSFKVT